MTTIAPCIPSAWERYGLDYRHGATTYSIVVENPHHVSPGVAAVTVEGVACPDRTIVLADDGVQRHVTVVMGAG